MEQNNVTQAPVRVSSQITGTNTIVSPPPLKYCLYARKSTESDEQQALSIDSQIKEMLEMAKAENMDITEIRKESHSAKDSGQRPVYNQLLADIRTGMFNGILCWAPDRLSRNAGDLGALVDLIDQGLLQEIKTHGQKFTNNPNEKFLLMILGSQAKLENDHKGVNVKRGLRAKCEKGWRPGRPPLGYIHDKYADKGDRKVFIDPERSSYIKQIFEKVAYDKWSGRDIYRWLRKTSFRSRGGKQISLSTIYQILAESFYHGNFEYPKESGKFYKGKHEPIITKELFEKVREKLDATPKRHPGTVDFAFTKLLYCGVCGSGITAEEKFKHQLNGNVHRYVYYHCTCGKDRDCKQPAIREEELIKQMVVLMDKVDIDKLKAVEKIKKEIQRFQKFNYIMSGNNDGDEMPKKLSDVNIKNYAKYILLEGTKQEKRDLLECLKSKLILMDKTINLE